MVCTCSSILLLLCVSQLACSLSGLWNWVVIEDTFKTQIAILIRPCKWTRRDTRSWKTVVDFEKCWRWQKRLHWMKSKLGQINPKLSFKSTTSLYAEMLQLYTRRGTGKKLPLSSAVTTLAQESGLSYSVTECICIRAPACHSQQLHVMYLSEAPSAINQGWLSAFVDLLLPVTQGVAAVCAWLERFLHGVRR